jgi:hypothetical protein
MIGLFILMTACGGDPEGSGDQAGGDPAPTVNSPDVSASQDNFRREFDFIGSAEKGEYVGIGAEEPENSRDVIAFDTALKFPTAHRWLTKLEFLTKNGQKVDPNSFLDRPRAQRERIRMTLESDERPGMRFVAEGMLFFRWPTGSILGGRDVLRGPNFEIHFPFGIDLQLLDNGDDRRIANGVIILIEKDPLTQAVRKHRIQYFGDGSRLDI